ncbi:MAG: alpha/beta hydrolase [Saprospiraceae bacterium]|nr:lysophospholipase [Lewinella sp.]
MEALTFNWTTKDGVPIYGRVWLHPSPVAVLSIVHGMGEHINRYNEVAEFYHQAGFAVVGNDHRGHGQSGGKRGHAPNYESLLDEVDHLVEETRSRYPGLPHFLFGQSLGGNLVLNYCLRRRSDFAGIVASSPWVQLTFKPNPVSVAAGKLMQNIYPAFLQSTGLDPDHLSTISEVGEQYRNDPLVHDRISASMGMAMLKAADDLNTYSGNFPCPLLVLHGTGDQIVSVPAARAFAERLEGDITYRSWDGLYHELHNEVNRQEVLETTLHWMQSKLE